MVPEQAAVAALVQLGDTHPVPVRLDVLGYNVHGNLAQIEVCSHTCGGRDTGSLKHIQNELLSHLPPGKMV